MKRTAIVLTATALLIGAGCVAASEVELATDDDKILYTLGLAISQNLSTLDLTEKEVALIEAGLEDGVFGRDPRVEPEQFGSRIQGFLQQRVTSVAEKEKAAGEAFLAEAAEEPGAVKTDSGLVFLELESGEGASPTRADSVKVHYEGTLRDGTVFDSSREGDPATFSLGGVIGCFSEGLQKMKVGGKARLTCPASIAYGDRGSPPSIRPGATLVFEVELIDIVGQPEPATP